MTYSLTEDPNKKHVALFPLPVCPFSPAMWQRLAGNIANEKHLTPYSASILSNRWQQGRAAVIIKNDEIISYISVVPIFSQAAHQALSEKIGVAPSRLPDIEMYESSAGWTHRSWRQRGMNLQLRRHLLKRFSGPNCLHVSIAAGLGASPIVAKLGWKIIAWGEVAYVSSFFGLPVAGLEDKINGGWPFPTDLKLYEGPHVSPERDTTHPWERFCHFWVSNVPLALEMNHQLSTLVNGDLHRWREALVTAFVISVEPTWRPYVW